MPPQAQELVAFWFSDAAQPCWFESTPAFDAQLRERYGALARAARAGELDHWADSVEGALALILLLDQVPRNIYRGRPESFASDAHALRVARQALAAGFDQQVDVQRRCFFYMPFMHSERLADQDQSVALFEAAEAAQSIEHARQHRDLIARFGRFPHRNGVLGRASTDAERRYLASDDAFRV